jgi:hypothetical protein
VIAGTGLWPPAVLLTPSFKRGIKSASFRG